MNRIGFKINSEDEEDIFKVFDEYVDSSKEKILTEKFSLSEDGLFLYAEITVDDPVYLTEPHTFYHRWKKIADREVIQAPCTMESAKLYLQGG